MRILVAGRQGQVGSALGKLGAEQGLDLVALDRTELDITNASSISAAFEKYQPGVLINAAAYTAAYTAVDKAESESELAFAINETATALLADECATASISIVHISTDYVFDGSKEGLYREDDPVNPLAIYGKSKEAGERALRERVLRHVTLHTSWVFGVQDNNFVKTMVHLAKDRDRLTVVSDQFGGPSSADGIAEALLTIAAQFERLGNVAWGTYRYCQKPYVSWYQFAEGIITRAIELGMVDHPVEVTAIPSSKFPTPVTRPSNSRLDAAEIESKFCIDCPTWASQIDSVIKASV